MGFPNETRTYTVTVLIERSFQVNEIDSIQAEYTALERLSLGEVMGLRAVHVSGEGSEHVPRPDWWPVSSNSEDRDWFEEWEARHKKAERRG